MEWRGSNSLKVWCQAKVELWHSAHFIFNTIILFWLHAQKPVLLKIIPILNIQFQFNISQAGNVYFYSNDMNVDVV